MTKPSVLVLAYSSIVQRRVLPALAKSGVTQVDIASRGASDAIAWPEGVSGKAFEDYDTALNESAAEVVWISTVNSTHAELARTALTQGRHVLIDKPATTTLSDTEDLIALAESRGVALAEANVFAHHPQIAVSRRPFDEAGSEPKHIVAAFSYPVLPAGNFRHDPALGGGILLDLGPYAVSFGRLYFGVPPDRIHAMPLSGDRGFTILASYPGERTLSGHFGTGTGYVNRATLLGPDVAVNLERIFTTPPDQAGGIAATVRNQPFPVEMPVADSFEVFLRDVFDALDQGDPSTFRDTMLQDARALEQLRVSLSGG